MCRKLICLLSLVSLLSLTSAIYADVVIGDFEDGMDNWVAGWEGSPVLANSTIGVTSGNESLSVTSTGGYWCLQWNAPTVPRSVNGYRLEFDLTMIASEWPVSLWTKVADKIALNSDGPSGWKEYTNTTAIDRLTGESTSLDWGRWSDAEPDALKTYSLEITDYDLTGATWFQINIAIQGGDGVAHFYFDNINLLEPPATIIVEPGGDIAAANALAVAGDTIDIAAGTYAITEAIEIKDGVTYQGAGSGLTIIDGNNVTRAFVAWGDRGATNGQVDVNGVGVPNATGPTGWVLDGLMFTNCVSDTLNRQDILSAARDLLNNYTGTPYTLVAAQAENGGIEDNPGWFDILSGSADDDLTDVELQAYLDANPVGSAGHLVVNDDKRDDGGAVCILNGAAGTIKNCDFSNNTAVDDGGAIMVDGDALVVVIENCTFNINTCGDQAGALKLSGAESNSTVTGCSFTDCSAPEDDGGAIQMDGAGDAGSIYTLTGCTFTGCSAFDDGGAILATADNSTYVWTDCAFIGNYVTDSGADGGAVRYNSDRAEMTVTNCSFIGNGKDPDGTPVGDDRIVRGNVIHFIARTIPSLASYADQCLVADHIADEGAV